MDAETFRWREVARAWYEKYAETLREANWYVEPFDDVEESEVEAIIAGLKFLQQSLPMTDWGKPVSCADARR